MLRRDSSLFCTGSACPHITAGPAKQHSITPSTYFGSGVVKNIQDSCTEYEPNKVFVNAALSPVQQRNLELAVGMPVLDRVGLIIDIFAQRARTREARLQVRLPPCRSTANMQTAIRPASSQSYADVHCVNIYSIAVGCCRAVSASGKPQPRSCM